MPYRGLRGSEDELRDSAPLLHAYLSAHAAVLDARRSSIYQNAPRFATFGVGPYSFALHKVAVSGLHRAPRFVVLSGDRPIQVSDTAYTLGFQTALDARLVAGLLSSRRAIETLAAGIFRGKRPITKRLLMQLDLRRLVDDADVARDVIRSLPSSDRTAAGEDSLMHHLRDLVSPVERPDPIAVPA
jgi:hypothetical protein